MFIAAVPKPLEVHASLATNFTWIFTWIKTKGLNLLKQLKTGEHYFELKFAANYKNSWPLK